MKITRLTTVLALSLLTLGVVAQQEKKAETKEPAKETPATTSPSKGNGNAEAMRRNLNFPNATNPADHNNQKYDKGDGRIVTEHPDDNLGNHYNRKQLEEKKK